MEVFLKENYIYFQNFLKSKSIFIILVIPIAIGVLGFWGFGVAGKERWGEGAGR